MYHTHHRDYNCLQMVDTSTYNIIRWRMRYIFSDRNAILKNILWPVLWSGVGAVLYRNKDIIISDPPAGCRVRSSRSRHTPLPLARVPAAPDLTLSSTYERETNYIKKSPTSLTHTVRPPSSVKNRPVAVCTPKYINLCARARGCGWVCVCVCVCA